VHGAEAGGHRGSFRDDPAQDGTDGIGLLALLQLVRHQESVPLVAAGGIASGAGVAAVLAAGAAAAQLGPRSCAAPRRARRTCSGRRPPALRRRQ
jgi:nitronate monooxygenase